MCYFIRILRSSEYFYVRHDNALAHGALSHVFAMHVELIRRREFIKRGVPLRARIRLVDKDEIAVLA
jgi:hypothetical protein